MPPSFVLLQIGIQIGGVVATVCATIVAVKVGLVYLEKRVEKAEGKLDRLHLEYVPRSEVELGLASIREMVEKTYSLVEAFFSGGRTLHAAAEQVHPLDQASEDRLALVHPELARRVRAAMAALAPQGTFFRVAEGLRTYAQQDVLYAQGRSAPGHIVTHARGGYSSHNFGLAVDCFPFLSGHQGPLNSEARSPQFQAMVEALEAQGLVWGGCWHSLADPPHFQLPGVPATPTGADRAAFAAGGLAAVWSSIPPGQVV